MFVPVVLSTSVLFLLFLFLMPFLPAVGSCPLTPRFDHRHWPHVLALHCDLLRPKTMGDTCGFPSECHGRCLTDIHQYSEKTDDVK